jgi:peptidoglycan hydrolase-like protein with peptidoglycan-binding domain
MKTRSIILIAMALAILLGVGSHVLAQTVGTQDQQAAGQQDQRMAQDQRMGQEETVVQGAQLYIGPTALRSVKEQLQQMGHNPGQINGEWNNQVQQALMQFQQAQNLEPTGNLNLETIEAMDVSQILQGRESAQQMQQQESLSAREQGAPLFISPAAVRNIQQRLQQAGHDPGEVDGKWGPATQSALKEYQQAAGLEPTGLASLRLLSEMGMDQELAVLTGEDVRAGLQAGEGQQQRGYIGQEQASAQQNGWGAPLFISMDGARQIQQSLRDAGHDPGPIDGLWGPRTAEAAREFQNEKGLEPTGNLNISTLQELQGGLDFELAARGRQETQQQDQQVQDTTRQQPGESGMQPDQPGQATDQPGQTTDQPTGQTG